jgi:5-methylcytosine-specific restriction endonuclease McrA
MTSKVCSKCGETKDESEFTNGKHQCKECKRKYDVEYREKNKEKLKAQQKKYDEEHKEHRKGYIKNYCKLNREKITDYYRTYRKINPEKEKEAQRKYAKTENGKLKEARVKHNRRSNSNKSPCTLTTIQWEKILESQGNKCAICGNRFCKSRPPTKDHIVPLSKGGGFTFENVQALCRSCNSSKNARLDHTKIITWEHGNYGITT